MDAAVARQVNVVVGTPLLKKNIKLKKMNTTLLNIKSKPHHFGQIVVLAEEPSNGLRSLDLSISYRRNHGLSHSTA